MANVLLDLFSFLFVFPVFLFLISVDRLLFAKRRNPFLTGLIPRTIAECTPQALFRMVVAGGANGNNAAAIAQLLQDVQPNPTLLSADIVAGTKAEPDKPVLSATLRLRNGGNTAHTTTRVFLKLPTDRPWSIAFRAIMSTFQVHRECLFYNEIYPTLKRIAAAKSGNNGTPCSAFADRLRVPKVVFAGWSRAFDRAAVMTEYIDTERDYVCIPDSEGVNAAAIRAMIDAIVPLHALSWDLREPEVAKLADTYFRDKVGMAWMDALVKLYGPQIPASSTAWTTFWTAVVRSMSKSHMTISHGDFRSGNQLFPRGSTAAASSDSNKRVIITDWEAMCVSPFMFDFTYAITISLPPEIRRREEAALLEYYVASLHAALLSCCAGNNNKNNAVPDKAALLQEAQRQVRVLKVAIRVWSFLIYCFGGVGEQQRNTANDMAVWRERVEYVCHETLRDQEAQLAADLGIAPQDVRSFYEELKVPKILRC